MFTSATIGNFRGIERLTVEGLGRVNLIIGKNNSGKTALMESLLVAAFPAEAGQVVAIIQGLRMPGALLGDFDDFWRPVFRSGNAERGFSVVAKTAKGEQSSVAMNRSAHAPMVTTSDLLAPSKWMLEYWVATPGQVLHSHAITGGPQGVDLPMTAMSMVRAAWIPTGNLEPGLSIRQFSLLRQQGRDEMVYLLLRQLDEQIQSVELLSLASGQATVFVRVKGEQSLLPLQMMGEGVQRCFNIAVSIAAGEPPLLAVDEIENGLHHSVMKPVWRWMAEVSAKRGIQIFATTHSEECVHAACQAFIDLGDDGLKVIRLDRQEHQTVAKVYDRDLIAATERMDIEIRG